MTEPIMTQTDVIDERWREEEIRRRLPEVTLIDDEELREETIDALRRGLPRYFWEAPATNRVRYHNLFARRRHGLWIHVKMVATAFERKAESYVKRGVLTEYEADCVRAAILLHDMLKYGTQYEEGSSTADNHDLLAGQWLRRNTELPQPVIDGVEQHNGAWYEGPEPDSDVSEAVHLCDMDGSTSNGTWGLYEPAEEITEKYPEIPRANLWD